MVIANPNRFGFEDGEGLPESPCEFMRISDSELRHFERVETAVLKTITPNWTPIPESFLFAEFTRTLACGEAVLGTLWKYAWDYVVVKLHNGIRRGGRLSIPSEFDSNDAENPGYKAELSEWGRLTYVDLMQWIHISVIDTGWTDWLTDRTGDRVGGIL